MELALCPRAWVNLSVKVGQFHREGGSIGLKYSISEIGISDVATFQETQTLNGLKKFNYLFGTNGTGKTTISGVIDSPNDYPSCSITWENQSLLEVRVYNRNFLDQNFNQQKLKGVFTLGETATETVAEIETLKASIEELKNGIVNLIKTLQGTDGNSGKKLELSELNETYKKKFWTMKQKHNTNLGGGMTGYLNSTDKFMGKVLSEYRTNTAILLTQSELEEKAKTVFSNSLTSVPYLTEINVTEILQHEKNPILQKRIIGKDDVDIAAMILKLNNSDWVRQGLSFFDENNDICPFCQQPTTESFRKSLSEYFDESFTQDSSSLKILAVNYSSDAQRLQNQIQELIDAQSYFLDVERLKTKKQLLDSIIIINKQRLAEKQKESSKIITLDSLENVLKEITTLIITANTKITENNRIESNLKNEKSTLTSQIWKFIISEIDTEIAEYKRLKTAIENALTNISSKITGKSTEKRDKERSLRELEKLSTSIIPTRDSINHLLDSFGFKSFKLALADEPNTYKLVREDGSDAQNSLSEGEKNFLTFLYFYYLLKGSQNETGIDKDKIVVIDDPISSLDNDVLFIVSTLIRELIQDARENKGSIKQIFILTHNIYFHKEVTFNRKRNNCVLSEETFWLVKKKNKTSYVEKQNDNPIKTSYELLWDEVRKDTRNNATIQNTLRRILENYFKLLGSIPLDKLFQKFEGEDKLKCKALCSWINDGSHNSFDEDFYTSLDPEMIQKFLGIFKQIFQITGHIAHYNMMMGIDNETEVA
jgi:wobble nucleotide-excising tRNase